MDDIRGSADEDTTLVVVAHSGVTVDALRTFAGDGRVKDEHPTLISEGVPCCAITTLEHVGGGWAALSVACTNHLHNAVEHR